MAARVRRVSILLAVLAAAAVLVPAGSASSRDAGQPALPTLYVVYTMNCTFSIVDDPGRPVTAIAPGTYQVEVSTPIMFKLVVPGGPGGRQHRSQRLHRLQGLGSVPADRPGRQPLDHARLGCDAFYLLPAQTFKPSRPTPR